MATTVSTFRGGSTAVEWPNYAVVFASTCIVVGLLWDISWHRTIGRDTFWSPPHLLQQLAAVVAGVSCGYLVLRTTFAGSAEARERSVRFWRFFQGPIGAWVCIWGTITLISAAPFDNWWHNAYGLDVGFNSPPHLVLAVGMVGIQLGALLMVLGAQNRATREEDRRRLGLIVAYAAGIVLVMVAILLQQNAAFGNQMNGSFFYKLTAGIIPLFLVAFARASRLKWPATTTASLYMGMVLVSMWVIQLFPAQARLAPIYISVTHMVPPPFPLLLVFPALAIDILMQRFGTDKDWRLSVAIGVSFVIVMVAAHWFWANFLLSPAARNFVVGADQWEYSSPPGPWQYKFWNLDRDDAGEFSPLLLTLGLGIAIICGIISARLGLWWGREISRIKR